MIPSAARLLTPLADRGLLEDPPPPRARLCGRLRLRGCLGIRSDPGGRLGQFWGLWRGASMNGLQGLAQLPRNREIRRSTSENSVKAKVAEFTYQEDKRCMLARLKSSADFLRGCAGKRIGHLLFATHPHHPGIRQLLRADMVMRTMLVNRARGFRASYSTSFDEVKGVKRAPRY